MTGQNDNSRAFREALYREPEQGQNKDVHTLYAVYDQAVEEYLTPFVAANDNAARRMFVGIVMDQTTMVGMHPTDFDLYYVGTIDRGTAQGDLFPRKVMRGTEAQNVAQSRSTA